MTNFFELFDKFLGKTNERLSRNNDLELFKQARAKGNRMKEQLTPVKVPKPIEVPVEEPIPTKIPKKRPKSPIKPDPGVHPEPKG